MSSLYNLRNRTVFTREDKWHVLLLIVDNIQSEWFRSRMRCTSKYIALYCEKGCQLHDVIIIQNMNRMIQSTLHVSYVYDIFIINDIIKFKILNKNRISFKLSPNTRFICKDDKLEQTLFSYTIYPHIKRVFERIEKPLSVIEIID